MLLFPKLFGNNGRKPNVEACAPYVAAELLFAFTRKMAPRRPKVKWRPRLHSLLLTTMQTGRSLESSQIQDCSSGKLSKAFHTSTATVTVLHAERRELCLIKESENNIIGASLSEPHTSRTSVQSRYYHHHVACDLPYNIVDQNCISYTHYVTVISALRQFSAGTYMYMHLRYVVTLRPTCYSTCIVYS